MREVMRTCPATVDGPGARSVEREKRRPPSIMLRLVGASLLLSAVAGCAGARVTDVTSAKPAGRPPVEILVEVTAFPATDDAQAKIGPELADKLRSDLVERLTKAGVSAEPFVPGTTHPGAALLHVSITEAEPGSYMERFIIGFGLGRTDFRAKADLESADTAGAYSLTAFDTSSGSGRMMPGLILPGALALATRNLLPLAIGGGIRVATSFRGGLDGDARETAAAVVKQLKTYYASVGWPRPAAGKTWQGGSRG